MGKLIIHDIEHLTNKHWTHIVNYLIKHKISHSWEDKEED